MTDPAKSLPRVVWRFGVGVYGRIGQMICFALGALLLLVGAYGASHAWEAIASGVGFLATGLGLKAIFHWRRAKAPPLADKGAKPRRSPSPSEALEGWRGSSRHARRRRPRRALFLAVCKFARLRSATTPARGSASIGAIQRASPTSFRAPATPMALTWASSHRTWPSRPRPALHPDWRPRAPPQPLPAAPPRSRPQRGYPPSLLKHTRRRRNREGR